MSQNIVVTWAWATTDEEKQRGFTIGILRGISCQHSLIQKPTTNKATLTIYGEPDPRELSTLKKALARAERRRLVCLVEMQNWPKVTEQRARVGDLLEKGVATLTQTVEQRYGPEMRKRWERRKGRQVTEEA